VSFTGRGADNWSAWLGEEDVREIRRLVGQGVTQRDLAARFGVSRSAVSAIVNRRTWAWLDPEES